MEKCENGESKYSISVLTGIDPPYRKQKNGDIVFLKCLPNLPPITHIPYQKEFITPCRDAIVRTYRWGDIPKKCRTLLFGKISTNGSTGLW